MKKWKHYFILGGILLLVIITLWGFNQSSQPIREATWNDLRQLDAKNHQVPLLLQGMEQAKVRLAGFAVPLDMQNWENVDEFLLVPDPMSCIHVPAPPPNQIVYVKMRKGVSMERLDGAVMVLGNLTITPSSNDYGEVSYTMDGILALPYRQDLMPNGLTSTRATF